MLEAVNSVVSNAPLLRSATDTSRTDRGVSTAPDSVQRVQQAPYVSPYIFVDVNFDKAVLQIRDSENGTVERQYPSEEELLRQQAVRDAERRAESQALAERPVQDTESSAPVQASAESPAPQTVSVEAPANAAPTASPQAASVEYTSTATPAGSGGEVSVLT